VSRTDGAFDPANDAAAAAGVSPPCAALRRGTNTGDSCKTRLFAVNSCYNFARLFSRSVTSSQIGTLLKATLNTWFPSATVIFKRFCVLVLRSIEVMAAKGNISLTLRPNSLWAKQTKFCETYSVPCYERRKNIRKNGKIEQRKKKNRCIPKEEHRQH
jgi:hypothetical protein